MALLMSILMSSDICKSVFLLLFLPDCQRELNGNFLAAYLDIAAYC